MPAQAQLEFTPEEKEDFWWHGFLSWKLTGDPNSGRFGQLKIEEAFQATAGKLFVGDCSRQLGKSTWAAAKCVELALRKRRARIRYATAFLSDLEQFIVPAFELILEDIPTLLKPVWRAQKSEWYFPTTGSKIRLIGLDRKPNGLRGNKLDLVVLDEAGYISRLSYIYKFVLIPATTHVPDAKIIMISTQPETPDHDFVEFCDKAEIEMKEGGGSGYVKIDVDENPLLTKEQIDDIAIEFAPSDPFLTREEKVRLGRASTAFRREYLCERVVEEERAIIPEFREKLHVLESPRCPAFAFWYRLEALDSGVRDLTACLFGYYDFARAKAVIEDEFAIQGAEVTTKRIAQKVHEKETLHKYGEFKWLRRMADNNNLILIQDLAQEEHKLVFNPTGKDDLHAMVNKVRVWMGSGRIEIHPRCVRLISALKAGIWNNTRSEFGRSKIHGHYDLIASLVYFIRNIPEHQNNVPPYFGSATSDVIYPRGTMGQNRNAETLMKAFGVKK